MDILGLSSPDLCREPHHLFKQKKFKFYEIQWRIENFYAQCCQESWEICSPEVEGPQNTKLVLLLKRRQGEDNTFSFLAERSACDLGPDLAWANFRLGIEGAYDAIKCVEKNKLCPLLRGTECETGFVVMERLFEDRHVFKDDWFCINCVMIIYIHEQYTGLEVCSNAGLRSLSAEMLALYESGRGYDIELKIGRIIVQAHKCILCARSEFLNTVIDRTSDCKALDLSDIVDDADCESVSRVLAYIYTGDMKHVIEKPSLYIYQLSVVLCVPDVRKYYACEILSFKSTLNSQVYIFKWSIRDINSVLESNKYILSPVFTDSNTNRTFQLHFCPQGALDEDYVAIFVETNELIYSMNVWLEISATDEGSLNLANILHKKSSGCLIFGFNEFTRKICIKSCTIGNVLNIAIRLKLSDVGTGRSEIEQHCVSTYFMDCSEMSFKLLSLNMRKYFVQGSFYDCVLQTNEVCVRIHKCILAARCKVLYDMFAEKAQDEPLVINDVRLDILGIVLVYIYSGYVTDIKEQYILTEVCKVAKYFNLPHLEEACTKVLENR